MNKSVLKLAIPSILANITVPLVGMVDLAIAGRLGDASVIGGIAIASMLFDLLYWNMGFLRLGTGGMVAQAYGRRDFKDAMRVFVQGLSTALVIAFIILLLQYLYVNLAFRFIECSPSVEKLARDYYNIRIWAAPATLSLLVFKGFFIGMQNAVSSMVVDVTVNVLNLFASAFFALYAGMGFSGIAMGTAFAQYTGLLVSIVMLVVYYKKLFKYVNVKQSVRLKDMKKFFVLNANLFVRSVSFLFIYAGFTSLSAKYGDLALAVGSIMMKLMLLYSYFVDGFAYAGEALSGRFIGAGDLKSLKLSVKVIFIWCIGISVVSTFGYWLGSDWLIAFMTTDAAVIEESAKYTPWLLVMPLMSCIAFTWDGIFIGATASKAIRNSMLWAVVGFFLSYFLLKNSIFMQSLWVAYMVHLLIRSVYLTLSAKKDVFSRV